MKPKKHLSFTSLRKHLSRVFYRLKDDRQDKKSRYSLHDAFMSGFACMYFQDPSLLQFQKRLERKYHSSNLKTLFAVQAIPESTQLRELIDAADAAPLREWFKEVAQRLQRGKHLEQYQLFSGQYYCPLDGTQYFSSASISCKHCLHTQDSKKGRKKKIQQEEDAVALADEGEQAGVSYSHKVVQAAIMHPRMRQVIPMMPEEIRNTDGQTKQDCEVSAAKRLLPQLRQMHPRLGLIIGGDDLYSRQPMIEAVQAQGMHYLFVAKPQSHVYLSEWLAAYPELHRYEETDAKGMRHCYEWMNKVPLHGGEHAPLVHFLRYRMVASDAQGQAKTVYHNDWVTDMDVTSKNIKTLVQAGRCRWKIENECFNTLKNQGYAIEHNYGHGKQNLCFHFYLLTLIAFAFHQILELTDRTFQACRQQFGSKRHLWENARLTLRYFVFENWEIFLEFLLNAEDYLPDEPRPPPMFAVA